MMARILVFDVQETLLDLGGLDAALTHSFAEPGAVRRAWFAQLLQSAFVGTITNHYVDYLTVGDAALQVAAAREDVVLAPHERQRILAHLRQLPAHGDVAGALARLREHGLRLVALSNIPRDTLEAQLTAAKLRDDFEQVFSADEVRRLKPAPEPYQMVAERLGVAIGELRLVSAHAWDIAGALRAGAKAAYVQRPGQFFDPLVSQPDAMGEGLAETAERILEAEGLKRG